MTREVRQKQLKKRSGICILLCLLAVIVFKSAAVTESEAKTVITLEAESVKMVQDGEKPALKAKASGTGDLNLILDEKTGYKAQDLLNDLNAGKNFKILCDADGTTDGKFPINLELEKAVEDSLIGDWLGKIRIDVKKGTFVVENKYGRWEEKKFKKTDGSYAASEYVYSGGNKYYFDKDGKMVTGKRQIGTKKCEFAEDGKLISEENFIDPNKPMLALTFDDGPGRETGRILDELEKYGARATFFMLGKQVDKFPETVKKMNEIGCELANHSRTHTAFTKLTPDEMRGELGSTSASVEKATGGAKPNVFRPPYGKTDDTVKATVGIPIIMWSLDTLDWQTRNTQSTIDIVMNEAKDGSIVLMHDIHKESVEATVQLIPKLIEKGYQLVTVSELAEARGAKMENGVRYSQFYPK